MSKWLEEFKKDVARRGAYLEAEDDNLVIVSHKTVTRLIKIVEGAEWGDYSTGQMYDYGCLFCKAEKNADDKHEPTCPYSDEYETTT